MIRSSLSLFALTTILALVLGSDPTDGAPPRAYKETVAPRWLDVDGAFWYRNELPGGTWEFVHVDGAEARRAPAFDHASVADALSELTDETIDAGRLPVENLLWNDDGSLELQGADASWRLDPDTGALKAADGSAGVEGIPFDRTIRPSRSTGGETYLTFLNRRAGRVKLWWIDGGGGRVAYAELAPGERRRQHTFSGHVWLATDMDGAVLAVFEAPREEATAVIDGGEPTRVAPEPAVDDDPAVPSPDGSLAAFVRDHDLYVRDTATGEERRLSLDGCAGDSYAASVQRARLVEMEYDAPQPPPGTPDVVWSPDSRRLIARRTRTVVERAVQMIESAPDDRVQPRLRSYPYLKPGDDVPVGVPHLFDVEGGEIRLDGSTFARPWNITDVHWSPDGAEFFFLYNERGHQVMRVIGVDAATGATRVVVDEVCETFFDYSSKTYLHHLDATDQLIWMSERDGWNHLYLYDRKRGRAKRQITRGTWVVRGVDRVDAEEGRIWIRASGVVAGQDPYFVHHCRVDLDGGGFTVLTEGDGTHDVQWSPGRGFFVDTWSRVDLPPRHVLRRADGSLACELEEADASEILATGRRFPERFAAPGRDGETMIHGIIHRPRDFDPDRSYPVIEAIYAGPHGQHVPKGFRAAHRPQSLVDRGFVVVQIDGMGTNWRSKAFHDVCWRDIADAGFPDRIAWMRAAADDHAEMDLTRVGIYGGSAGGQNAATAVFVHGDFYDAAVADCGCHDNRMDKIWWNEQWMGWPVGPHYEAQSNVTLAKGLEGALLLIVGELDHNVDPASTMQVVDALVEADKDFDMLVIPGAGHGAGGTAYGRRRTEAFFVEHLLGN